MVADDYFARHPRRVASGLNALGVALWESEPGNKLKKSDVSTSTTIEEAEHGEEADGCER
jgi:hypothetical protein